MKTKDWVAYDLLASSILNETKAVCESEYLHLISLFSHYSRCFDAQPQSGDGEAQIVRGAILSQTLNTFWAMIDLATKGFYIQSLIPLRHVYESWLSFWYLANHPDDAGRWLNPTWKMRPPKAETMRNRIDHPSKGIKSKLGDFQDELHRFAHIDPAAVLSKLEQEGEKTIIRVGVRFDQGDFRACTYGISLWLGNCLDAISSMIPANHDWHAEYQSLIDAILSFFDEYNQETGGIKLPESLTDEDAS